jgi:hypothetical protein
LKATRVTTNPMTMMAWLANATNLVDTLPYAAVCSILQTYNQKVKWSKNIGVD